MLYSTCIQQVLYSTLLYNTSISYIAMLMQRPSYIAPVQAIEHDPRFQMTGSLVFSLSTPILIRC